MCLYHLKFQQSPSSLSYSGSSGQTVMSGLFGVEGSQNSIIPAVNAYGNTVVLLVRPHIPDELKNRVYR